MLVRVFLGKYSFYLRNILPLGSPHKLVIRGGQNPQFKPPNQNHKRPKSNLTPHRLHVQRHREALDLMFAFLQDFYGAGWDPLDAIDAALGQVAFANVGGSLGSGVEGLRAWVQGLGLRVGGDWV